MTKKLLGLLLSAILVPAALFAQSGKVAGKVTDSKTGEALALANVIIDGTTFGAATNENGEYVILNVAPGTYTIKARYLGYSDQTISNIVVNSGLTRTVNFKLSSSDQELQTVEVVAERPLVNPNATNATAIKTSADIENLAVRGVNNIVALQAGVVLQGGNIYVRGARADETSFVIEGVNVNSALFGGSRLSLIDNTVEEMQVQTGGQGADYGGANGGVVSSSMKAGGSTYKFTAEYLTDGFDADGKNSSFGLMNGFTRGYNEGVLTVSGPIIQDLNFYIAGSFNHRESPAEFWDGLNVKDIPVSYTKFDTVTHAQVGYDSLLSINYPNYRTDNPLTQYDLNGNLTFNFNPFIIKYTGVVKHVNWRTQDAGAFFSQFNPDKATQNINTVQLHSLKITQNIDPTMYYSVNFSFFNDFQTGYDPDFKDDVLAYGDPAKNSNRIRYQNTIYNKQSSFSYSDWSWGQKGAVTANYLKTNTQFYGINGQITKQLGRVHELKGGFEYTKYTIRRVSYNASRLAQTLLTNQTAQNYDFASFTKTQQNLKLMRDVSADAYGYDIYGNDVDGGLAGAKEPVFAGAYAEDKLEYQDLVLKLGVRYDFIDAKSLKFANADKSFSTGLTNTWNSGLIEEKYMTNAAARQYVSPRIGLSLPVTDKTVFHANYGQYVQQTRLRDIYLGWGSFSQIMAVGGNAFQNPVGLDLDPTRTTSYEIGFNQQVSDNASFDLTAFYNDKNGQIQIRQIAGVLDGQPTTFYGYQNGDFATTSGIQASMTLRRTNRVSSNVSYTYSDARGTGSASSSQFRTLWLTNNNFFPQYQSPLAYNYLHSGSVEVDYRFGKNDGPEIAGIKLLEQLGVNLLYTFNSGHPFTKFAGYVNTASTPTEAVGTSTTPYVTNLNVRIDKSFSIADFNLNAYIRIDNFFNAKNVLDVYGQTGNADNDGYLSTTSGIKQSIANGPKYAELYNAYTNANRPDLYDSPRQVIFGLKAEF